MTRKKIISFSLAILAWWVLPVVVSAHAFGQQYNLPLPFSLYALGASCALLASFVVLGLYSTPRSSVHAGIARVSFHIPRFRAIEITLRCLGVFALVFAIICGFFGAQDFTVNPTPILFWVVLLLGMTYLSVFVGGLWRLLNPFETIGRILFARRSTPFLKYPKRLGYLPALVFYYCLVWFELLSSGAGAIPIIIAEVLVGYLVLSLIGIFLFGREVWFKYCDFFSVFFGLIERFAPFSIEDGTLRIQFPGERLIFEEAELPSLLVFILFMLSSTAFDGLQDTQIWWNLTYQSALQINFFTLEEHLILIASPFIFLGLYALVVWVMRSLTKTTHSYRALLLRFAYSLIPIAIAYNFAHYFTLLSTEFQALIPILSDPFAKGWNLFGTAHYSASGLISAQNVWYTQFSVILLGHIIATYIAHRIALREFSSRQQVLLGQLPMLILMVFYTVFGLWILSQAFQNGMS